MEKDYFKTKCFKNTEVKALVKSKEVRPFLRYRNGIAKDDKHFVTTLEPLDGVEVDSYSKTVYCLATIGKHIDIPLYFYKLPNGDYALYA